MVNNVIFPETETMALNYDGYSKKTPDVLLFAAAKATGDVAKRKWEKFVTSVNEMELSKKRILLMINHCDEENQWAPLHYAVHYDNYHVFENLTSGEERFKCDINLNGGRGENVLHIAARSPNIWGKASGNSSDHNHGPIMMYRVESVTTDAQVPKIVERMITLGADINDEDDESRTPLHIAVQYNRYNFVQELINRGANIRALTKLGANVLHYAFLSSSPKNRQDFTNIVKLLVHSDKRRATDEISLVAQVTAEGIPPLAFALCHREITNEIATLVTNIKPESLPVVLDFVGRRCTKAFLEEKSEATEFFKSFLHQLLFDYKRIPQFFHVLCRYNNISLLKLFAEFISKWCRSTDDEAKALIDQPDYLGYTPLLLAVFCNAHDCVEWLLKQQMYSLNLLARTTDEDNIIHICAKSVYAGQSFDHVWNNLLDAYKVDLLKQMNEEKDTPLLAAIHANNKTVFNSLLNYLESKNIEPDSYLVHDASNTTICHEACKIGSMEMLQMICTGDKDGKTEERNHRLQTLKIPVKNILLKQDLKGYTCLHWAVAKNHFEIVKYLIDTLHVEVDIIEDRRKTPFHLACEIGNVDMIVFLLEKKALTTMRDAQNYNGLEIAIMQQHAEAVKKLFEHGSWKDMMRNAQPIENTNAFDTPMRKLIRYLPDVALWLIDNKLTTTIGGPGQKVYKSIYDYEFYEDMITASKWYRKGHLDDKVEKSRTCRNLVKKHGVQGFFEYLCCCYFCCCCEDEGKRRSTSSDTSHSPLSKFYTQNAYTLVRNHPLFISNEQSKCYQLPQHPYNDFLRLTKLRGFGVYLFILSFLTYLIYLGLFTTVIFKGKPPHYFYNQANISISIDLGTCHSVIQYFVDNFNKTNDIFASAEYTAIKNTLYVIMVSFILKTVIVMIALFPRGFFTLATYLEILAVLLSYIYVLDWYPWQQGIILRCPVQYQLGAAGLLLSYINLLTYLRTAPIFDLGVYVLMLQVITLKFFRFLPVLLIMICGFSFTFWMFLQDQAPYATPIEAILRTSLMLFDLGYEDRLYGSSENTTTSSDYKLVYVIFILTAIVFSIFVINLLIGLAVGEIPSLMTQGKIWRTHLLYRLTSDYEIMRIQFYRFINFFACCFCCRKGLSYIMITRYITLEKDENADRLGMVTKTVRRFQKYLSGNIQEVIEQKTTNSTE